MAPHHSSRLFEPLQIGRIKLSSRIVMGPLCSNLADSNNVLQTPAAAEYYGSRAQEPGTLIIGEATFISPEASGTSEPRAGIWTPTQIAAWKEVVDAVHTAGSHIFLQIWALGRGADPSIKQRDGTGDVVSSSAVPETPNGHVPRALDKDEVWAYVRAYTTTAETAVNEAGFDGVELHGGNASLIDQFTQSCVNQRTDQWGGNVINRNRFALDIVRCVSDAIGAERVGFRLSPWSTYGGMGMPKTDTLEQFSNLIEGLKTHKIAYIHLVESRIAGRSDVEAGESLDHFIDLWKHNHDKPLILAGGFSPDGAKKAVDEEYKDLDVGIAFGRAFVTNPDLVRKLKDGIDLDN